MADVQPSGGRQTCPRRMSEFGPWEHEPNLDTWRPDAPGPSCSFCGSLHPDRFMALVREGWIVGPTDKNYKAYLSKPATDEERAEHKATWLAGFRPDELRAAAEERGESPDQAHAGLEAHYDAHIAPTMTGSVEVKFYFQHLSEEQRAEFIRLHNGGQMQVGYPGHFYQPPYFTRPAPTASDAPTTGA